MKYPKFINKGDVIGIIAPSAGAYSDQKKNKFKIMAVTKWVTEEPNTYQYLSVKISDEKGNEQYLMVAEDEEEYKYNDKKRGN